ncbi:hypothetical protein MASR1M48_17230 [Lactococcus petauri]
MKREDFLKITAKIEEFEDELASLDPFNPKNEEAITKLSNGLEYLNGLLAKEKDRLKKESTERDMKILSAYQDRIFATNQKQLFILLHDMRFCTPRQYHANGEVTLQLPKDIADRLEAVFEEPN